MKTGYVCLAALSLSSSSASESSLCNSATESTVQSAMDALMQPAIPVLNLAWPSISDAAGLDPLTALKNKDYWLSGDAKKACKAVCGAQGASCHSFKIHIDEAVVHGINDMTFRDIDVSDVSLSAQSNEVCNLEANATAGIEAILSVDVKVSGIRAKCKNAFKKWTENLWSGKATCKASTKDADVSLQVGGSLCDPRESKDLVAIDTAEVESVDFNLDQLDCKFHNGKKGIPYLPEIVDFFAPHLFSDIVDSLEPETARAITDAFDKEVLKKGGIPDHCAASSASVTIV